MKMRAFVLLLALSCCASSLVLAQKSSPAPRPHESSPWENWSFLLGEWVGSGSGDPGQGSGGFTLKPDLQGKVLVRTNYAEYPPAKDRPAYRHDDLMVIYDQTPSDQAYAMYFDSEGHVIRYEVQVNPSSKTAIFLSGADPGSPRYRLTYSAAASDTLSIKFEIAPPDHPEEFKTYIQATAKRK
jgi:hypothetical protein